MHAQRSKQVHIHKHINIGRMSMARDCPDIFAGSYWQDMKQDKHQKLIMRKETKRIGSFPPSVYRQKKVH